MTYHATEIGKVASFINGFPFKPEDWATSGLPIIRIQNLTDPSKPFNLTTRKVNDRYLVNKGDVLVSWSATIDVFEWAGDAALLNQHIFKVDFDAGKIDKQYFKVALKKTIADLSKFAHGSTMKHVVKKDFENHQIPLPPLDDQIRIAHLLGKVEGLIAQRKQHLQQLDDLLKSVFLEMFGDPVKNERQWKTQTFSRVGKFISGGTPSKSRDDYWVGSYPWVSPKDMKAPRIFDSEDHISDKVFDETSLKRIAPGHLLIVVRGMILAHSFPIAINMVDVAINQDMKAIKLDGSLRAGYVFHCLSALKRQILKLITTAGHGTKKFDSDVMEKLLVPLPPPEIQDDFVSIADKVEALKSRYQQCLTDLEDLYGALSQQAFKGELDLSRVPLPEIRSVPEKIPTTPAPEATNPDLALPEPKTLVEILKDTEARKKLLHSLLITYREQLGNQPLSAQHFMEAIELRLLRQLDTATFDLLDNLELDKQTVCLQDYEQVKEWVFAELAAGRLVQALDEAGNRIQLKVMQHA